MSRKKVFKISDEEIKNLYLNGNSMNDIAKIAQDTKGVMALRQRLIDLGVNTHLDQRKYRYKISRACRKYSFNEHYFDNINNEHKAYWLGFLMADGYNHESKTCVAIRLQEEDKEILEKFKKDIKYNGPIRTYQRVTQVNKLHRTYCELNLCSPYFSESLAKIGCVQGKTYTLELPQLEESLKRHFIRGYFDGDGCISITHRNNRTPTSKTYQFRIAGRENIVNTIKKFLCKNLDINNTNSYKCSSSFAVSIHWGGRINVTKIMSFLYKDSTIYMERKHNKYLELIGNSAE